MLQVTSDQIHIAVETLDDAGGESLFGMEKVDAQILVFADRLHELLDRFELESGGSVTPLFQSFCLRGADKVRRSYPGDPVFPSLTVLARVVLFDLK